ncbi:MAG: sn-glycerol-3-phosphate ABC transporter ATP-binding protein UgpC [Sulfitobacter sp.]
MAQVLLTDLKKSYGAVELFDGVNLEIAHGEFVVFVGPSGSGKSTLLRMIAGLESVTDGVIEIDGEDVTYEDPSDRGIAMVFQNYALYPHMDVFGNIAFNLRISGLPKAEVNERVMEAARILRLEDLLDRSPAQLSGGQRQRVAIGRAIVRKPKVFLFDEPLSNLDAALRTQMRLEIERLHREIGATMIYVTHDQTEAMTLADRIVALDYGEIQQVGTPEELYDAPANKFVGGFIGSPKMNFLGGTVIETGANFAEVTLNTVGGEPSKYSARGLTKGDAVTVGIRPEDFEIDQTALDGKLVLKGTVDTADRLGNITYAYVKVAEGVVLTVQTFLKRKISTGAEVTLSVSPGRVSIFDPTGKNCTGNTEK